MQSAPYLIWHGLFYLNYIEMSFSKEDFTEQPRRTWVVKSFTQNDIRRQTILHCTHSGPMCCL